MTEPAPDRKEFVAHPIVLRNGERIRPEEFPANILEPMHDALDAIAAETDEVAPVEVPSAVTDPALREAGW